MPVTNKSELLRDTTYNDYVLIGMIEAAKTVVSENGTGSVFQARKEFAKSILQNPLSHVEVFKSLICNSVDVSQWGSYSESQKVTGATNACTNNFNLAGKIY